MVGQRNVWSMKWRVQDQDLGRPKITRRETVKKDCKAHGLNREEAMDRSRWRKQIGIFDDHDRCELGNVSSGTGSPRLSRTKSKEP